MIATTTIMVSMGDYYATALESFIAGIIVLGIVLLIVKANNN